MSRVIHDECAICDLLIDVGLHGRIGIASRTLLTGVSVPINALDAIVGIKRLCLADDGFTVAHVGILVTIIAQYTDSVFPSTHLLILYIRNQFVNHTLGLCRGSGRNASNANSRLLVQQICCPVVIKQGEVFL